MSKPTSNTRSLTLGARCFCPDTILVMPTLGYLISFHTYGTWLHGRAEGSVDDDHAMPGTPFVPFNALREQRERQALKHPPVELDAERRFVVDATIREVCVYRDWRLHALNVRTTPSHRRVCLALARAGDE